MAAALEASYQPLQPFAVDQVEEETAQGVIFHVVPEGGKSARWNHVEDLDSFFSRMYHFHQKHGYTCMMLQEVFGIFQFIFIVVFTSYLFDCVSYSVLFRLNNENNNVNKTRISFSDATLPLEECVANIGIFQYFCLFIAFILLCFRIVKMVYHAFQYWDIKAFFNCALKVKDADLDNFTWSEIQRRILEVQREQQMCIHKRDLTELDIYHRILRSKNYFVAMINKNLLPLKLNVPFCGEIIHLSTGLKYNLEFLFFWGPGAPFEKKWHLKEDYKNPAKRKEVAKQLSTIIRRLAFVNLCLSPLIFLWQFLYFTYTYVELIKREPGALGSRHWSLYGREYLRHFNELDHELNTRLTRAYKPAHKYVRLYSSPLLTIISTNIVFVAGACLAVLILLSFCDEDVLSVEHVLQTFTVLGTVMAVGRTFIPDENVVWCPETLMKSILAQVHYLPDHWREQAHTERVRKEFDQLFKYRITRVLEEVFSPFITPFILWFTIQPKALDIVDFFRNFTVEVMGVGDVCSFAQMDVRRHGNPTWQIKTINPSVHVSGKARKPTETVSNSQYTQAEDGKTELSLAHFTLTNPSWKPPCEAEEFITELRNRAMTDAEELAQIKIPTDNLLYASFQSMYGVGFPSSSFVANINRINQDIAASESAVAGFGTNAGSGDRATTSYAYGAYPAARGGLSRVEGPLGGESKGLLHSLQALSASSLGASLFTASPDSNPINTIRDVVPAGMSLSTLLLHELHHQQMRQRNYYETHASHGLWQRPSDMPEISELGSEVPDRSQFAERTPLLDSRSHRPS